MRQPLKDGDGLPKWLIFVMAAITALTLSNCYYIQPLLGSVAQDIGTSQFNANIIVTMLQAGYGLGLFFIVPLGDLISARKMTTANFAVLIVVMALMAFADNVQMLWLYAVFIGACSVMPQYYRVGSAGGDSGFPHHQWFHRGALGLAHGLYHGQWHHGALFCGEPDDSAPSGDEWLQGDLWRSAAVDFQLSEEVSLCHRGGYPCSVCSGGVFRVVGSADF